MNQSQPKPFLLLLGELAETELSPGIKNPTHVPKRLLAVVRISVLFMAVVKATLKRRFTEL
ncbi:MAG: hypothetical protein IKC44_03130 [Burkholderiaceae bacterium]|nr:hypothetical protein [Burkholderiaceae bacterium]